MQGNQTHPQIDSWLHQMSEQTARENNELRAQIEELRRAYLRQQETIESLRRQQESPSGSINDTNQISNYGNIDGEKGGEVAYSVGAVAPNDAHNRSMDDALELQSLLSRLATRQRIPSTIEIGFTTNNIGDRQEGPFTDNGSIATTITPATDASYLENSSTNAGRQRRAADAGSGHNIAPRRPRRRPATPTPGFMEITPDEPALPEEEDDHEDDRVIFQSQKDNDELRKIKQESVSTKFSSNTTLSRSIKSRILRSSAIQQTNADNHLTPRERELETLLDMDGKDDDSTNADESSTMLTPDETKNDNTDDGREEQLAATPATTTTENDDPSSDGAEEDEPDASYGDFLLRNSNGHCGPREFIVPMETSEPCKIARESIMLEDDDDDDDDCYDHEEDEKMTQQDQEQEQGNTKESDQAEIIDQEQQNQQEKEHEMTPRETNEEILADEKQNEEILADEKQNEENEKEKENEENLTNEKQNEDKEEEKVIKENTPDIRQEPQQQERQPQDEENVLMEDSTKKNVNLPHCRKEPLKRIPSSRGVAPPRDDDGLDRRGRPTSHLGITRPKKIIEEPSINIDDVLDDAEELMSDHMVHRMLLADARGVVGIYTGLISARSRLPNGSGFMKYHKDNTERNYDGEWKEGWWQGQGKLLYRNGDRYDGELSNSQCHGKGKFVWAKQHKVFEGELEGNMPHGQGTLIMMDENGGNVLARYRGGFFMGKFQGRGRAEFPDGAYYDGEWQRDMYWGHGICVWPDGRIYEGEFANNAPNGRGIEKLPNGTVVHDGQWLNNEPVITRISYTPQ